MLQEETKRRLTKTMTNKRFNDIDTADILMTAVNAKLTASKTKLVENK